MHVAESLYNPLGAYNLRLCCCVFVCLCAVNFDHMYKLRAPVGTVEGFDISAFDKAVSMSAHSSSCIPKYTVRTYIVHCGIHYSLLWYTIMYCSLLWYTECTVNHSLCVAASRLGSVPPLRREWSLSHTPSGNTPPMQGVTSVN